MRPARFINVEGDGIVIYCVAVTRSLSAINEERFRILNVARPTFDFRPVVVLLRFASVTKECILIAGRRRAVARAMDQKRRPRGGQSDYAKRCERRRSHLVVDVSEQDDDLAAVRTMLMLQR